MRVAVLTVALGLVVSASANANVQFWYTETNDTCAFGQDSVPSNEITSHGGICAYRADVARIYSCPAPDQGCWTWGQDCNDNTVGQTVCNRNGAVWCCNAVAEERCTTGENQINVCVANFSSPNAGVSIADANAAYASVIGVSDIEDVTATSQSVQPTPFSTSTFGAEASTSARSTSSPISASDTSGTTQPSSATLSGDSTSATASNQDIPVESSNGLSTGAIAGIVIGAVAAIALVAIAFFLFMRKRSKTAATPVSNDSYHPVMEKPLPINGSERTPPYGSEPNSAMSELDGDSRSELPGPLSAASTPERHELP